MTEPQQPATPQGWYTDPQNPAQSRYWDGNAWTAHVAPGAGADVYGAPPTTAPEKKRLSTGAIIGIVAGAVVLVLIALGILAAIAMPIFLSQRAEAEDAAAKADVSTLGKEVATYWVDHSEPPLIEEVDGEVLIYDSYDTAVAVRLSQGVELGPYWIDSPTSWCISVMTEEGNVGTFRYSAAYGLEAGSC